MQDKSKNRLPRIERDEVVEVHEDDNAHLWAVSYSDFLMALLAFFILFFSFDGSKKENIIVNLAQSFSKEVGGGFGGSSHLNGAGGNGGKLVQSRLPSGIAEAISQFETHLDKKNEVLTVVFPDDLFKPGQFKIRDQRKKEIEKFFQVVKSYDGKVVMNIEGHTDSKPLRIHKTELVTDNFVLSSLRATSALNIARAQGLNEKFLFARAGSSNSRDSRSLTVRIETLKEIR